MRTADRQHYDRTTSICNLAIAFLSGFIVVMLLSTAFTLIWEVVK